MRIFARCCIALFFCLAACSSQTPELPPPAAPRATEIPSFIEAGQASWYGRGHNGKVTANGERFEMSEMTAAHRSLPFGTIVRVRNAATGKMVKVRINDRGPYEKHRVIDLSDRAARALGIRERGIAPVRLEVFASDQGEQMGSIQGDQTSTQKTAVSAP